jgi:predicted DNA-binding protein (UPF0251 family)
MLMTKTKGMKRVETDFGEKLETLLPRLINDYGMSQAADTMGISKASVGYWCMKLGIERRTVALIPGQRIEIRGTPRVEGS